MLIHIQEFVTLAETGSFTAAAERLYLSMSTLSRRIRLLEEQVGERLFERSPRRISLTAVGRLLLPHARRIMELEEQGRAELQRERRRDRTPLSIGCVPDSVLTLTESLIAPFVRENPNFAINIREAEPEALLEQLADGRCDLIFLHSRSAEKREDITMHLRIGDQLCAVLPPGHPAGELAVIPLASLKDEDFLTLQPGTLLHDFALAACREAGFEPNVVFTCSRSGILTSFVSAGMGVALVMERSIPDSGSFTAHRIEPTVVDPIVIVTGRRSPSFGARRFIRHAADTLQRKKEGEPC